MDLDLRGRTAVITAAGKGIGSTAAKELAKEGSNLLINFRNPGKSEKRSGKLISSFSTQVAQSRKDFSR